MPFFEREDVESQQPGGYYAILSNLVASLLEGRCLLFLGSGACVDADQPDLPTAAELSSIMAQECKLEWHEQVPLSTIAFYYESFFTRARLNKLLVAKIGDPNIKPSKTIRLLMQVIEILQKRGQKTLAITTNYDQQFESAYEEQFKRKPETVIYKGGWDPNDPVKKLNCSPNGELKGPADYWGSTRPTVLYKMHGCISQPDGRGLVITEEDYINFLANALGEHNADKAILHYVRGELVQQTILFIGYSLSDWNFRAIFKATVEKRLWVKDDRSYAVQFRDPAGKDDRWKSLIQFWNEKKVDILSVSAAQFVSDLLDILRPEAEKKENQPLERAS